MIHTWDLPIMPRKQIMILVCEEYNCTIDDLRGKRTLRNLSDARKVYARLTRMLLGDTVTRVGIELNRDHSTITIGEKQLDGFIANNDPIVIRIERIEQKFQKQKQK